MNSSTASTERERSQDRLIDSSKEAEDDFGTPLSSSSRIGYPNQIQRALEDELNWSIDEEVWPQEEESFEIDASLGKQDSTVTPPNSPATLRQVEVPVLTAQEQVEHDRRERYEKRTGHQRDSTPEGMKSSKRQIKEK